VAPAEIEATRLSLPELPQRKVQRWREELALGEDEAQALLQSSAFTAYFEDLASACGAPKAAAKWMLGEVSRSLNERSLDITAFPLRPAPLAALICLVEDRVLGFGAAREQVYPLLLEGKETAEALVRRLGLAQVADEAAIEALVAQVLAANPGPVVQHRGGTKNLTGFLTGQILKAGGGKLDPRVVQEVLAKALAKP
jgi:aspartyl-tRNA(Asn)/glutamyl-tRNA(Gln) amidotransferase subunit B